MSHTRAEIRIYFVDYKLPYAYDKSAAERASSKTVVFAIERRCASDSINVISFQSCLV